MESLVDGTGMLLGGAGACVILASVCFALWIKTKERSAWWLEIATWTSLGTSLSHLLIAAIFTAQSLLR